MYHLCVGGAACASVYCHLCVGGAACTSVYCTSNLRELPAVVLYYPSEQKSSHRIYKAHVPNVRNNSKTSL